MASSRTESRTLCFSLLPCLLLFALFTPTSSARTLPSDSGKVSLALYYESLCPYSANFIVNYLVKLFEDDLISIVDLKLSPWGNAKLRSNDTFSCQVPLFFPLFFLLLNLYLGLLKGCHFMDWSSKWLPVNWWNIINFLTIVVQPKWLSFTSCMWVLSNLA